MSASGSSARRLEDDSITGRITGGAISSNDLKDNAGVTTNAISDEVMSRELCNGMRLAIREETATGTMVYVADCRVIQLESDSESMNGRIVVYNSFEKFNTVKLGSNTATEDIKVKEDLIEGTN